MKSSFQKKIPIKQFIPANLRDADNVIIERVVKLTMVTALGQVHSIKLILLCEYDFSVN